MPELPEVEIVRRGLEPALDGRVFARVDQHRPDLRFPLPENFARALARPQGRAAGAAGKVPARPPIGWTCTAHAPRHDRVFHSARQRNGSRLTANAVRPRASHDHVVFHMRGGGTVTYNDPRRFGFMMLIPEQRARRASAAASPRHRAAERGADARVSGAACARQEGVAETVPRRSAHHRRPRQYLCVRGALSGAPVADARRGDDRQQDRQAERARACAGAGDPRGARGCHQGRRLILRDYRQADGELGSFQHSFCVYGREGKPCLRKGCGGTVRRIVQAGRSTFYCPRCQR